ncbi:PAP2-domain-containing protein [Rickenella mellea]|uniref:PAP2-domain-containing protein n=1 Tax=Rickenella mellea TaxID=50990 RepID=A0A4Y7QAW2_9AGAM|nr:PAP2-domain-containing protein [Rickenella mellea]
MRLLYSYAPDWILTIILAAIFFSLDKVPGFKREFSIDDTSLRYPYAVHERVPNWALYIIAFVAPLVIQSILNVLTVRTWWDFHNATLGLILSLSLTGAFTQFTKITVGRPRPDIISRCQPPSGVTNPPYGLVSVAICTQTDQAILRDGWRSFFSGHSSLSFAGLGFLSFYLAGKLHLFDERGHTHKAWIALTPLAGASLVAISRTMDYRHHWHDVLVGSFVGLLFSFFAYRQYYPPLSSPLSHHPFAPRIPRDGGDEGSEGPILPTANHPNTNTNSMGRGSTTARGHNNRPSSELFVPHGERYRDSFSNEHLDGEGFGSSAQDVELEGTVRRTNPELEDIYKPQGRVAESRVG